MKVVKNKKVVKISDEEYNNDNLIYHSMVHSLTVVSEKLDILEDKGYIFHKLKKELNNFRKELFKHTGAQITMMEQIGGAEYYNKFQKDYDLIFDFLAEAKPAQMTLLSELISSNKLNITEKDLSEMINNNIVKIEKNNGSNNS